MTKGCMLIISIIGIGSSSCSATRASGTLLKMRFCCHRSCRAKLSHMAASERFLIAARLWDATPCLPLHPPHLPYVSLSTPSSYLPLSFFPSLPLFSCFSITYPLSLFSSFPPHTIALTVPHKVSAPHQACILFPFLPPSPPACSSRDPPPPPSSTPVLLPPFSFSPLFPPSRVSSARLAARNASLHLFLNHLSSLPFFLLSTAYLRAYGTAQG